MAAMLCLRWALPAIVVALAAEPRPTKEQWDAAQQADKDEAGAAAARDSKLAAVDKAVDLLESLQAQVMKEGEEEAQLYNKFACFCKDTTKDRLASIKTGEDEQAELSSSIGALSTSRDELDTKIKTTTDDIKTLEKEMKEAEEKRGATFRLFSTNTVDLGGALEALQGAIQTLGASGAPSLVQMQSMAGTVRTATLLADALGLGNAATEQAAAFMQQPANEVSMEDYKFHSKGIIKTLEELLEDFKAKKNEVDKDEVESVHDHDLLIQEKTHAKKMKKEELATARKGRSQKVAEIARTSEQVSTVEATLLEDKSYTEKLQQMCSDKAKTWDQRTRVRSDELATLTEAVETIKGAVKDKTSAATVRLSQRSMRMAKVVAIDAASMDAIETAAEAADAPAGMEVSMEAMEAPLALVQLTSQRRGGNLRATVSRHPEAAAGRDVVVRLLKSQGRDLRSTLLTALASKIAADPLAKVKQLINELVERLLQEAANEANQKGWCDKAMSDATQKRDFAAEEIAGLNSAMQKLEADRDRLSEELSDLAADLKDIKSARTNATEDRTAEQAQNNATMDEATDGLTALNLCIDVLDKFYKTIQKETVDLSLAQQGPMDDAPDAGFKIGEAYTGAQGEAGGILGMLDVMKSDFVRTISETEKAEAQAEQDHLEFLTASGMALAQKGEAESQKKEQRSDVLSQYQESEELFFSESDKLQGALKELKDLKPTCIKTAMPYEERVARREEEMASLKKALCILGKYEQYGPEGAAQC